MITVLSPQSNHIFIQETFSPIKIEFDASDLDGEITEATVTIGDTIYYPEKSDERYTLLWTATSYGNYTIALKARDNDNSDVVRNRNITVSQTLNNAPTLNVVSPQNNQNFVQDVLSPITIAFDAQDSDGIVEHTMTMIDADHYDMSKIGDRYTLEWTPPSYGSYTIALHATDDSTASTMKSITVNILQEEIITPLLPAWDTSSIYTAGDEVSYNNNI